MTADTPRLRALVSLLAQEGHMNPHAERMLLRALDEGDPDTRTPARRLWEALTDGTQDVVVFMSDGDDLRNVQVEGWLDLDALAVSLSRNGWAPTDQEPVPNTATPDTIARGIVDDWIRHGSDREWWAAAARLLAEDGTITAEVRDEIIKIERQETAS